MDSPRAQQKQSQQTTNQRDMPPQQFEARLAAVEQTAGEAQRDLDRTMHLSWVVIVLLVVVLACLAVLQFTKPSWAAIRSQQEFEAAPAPRQATAPDEARRMARKIDMLQARTEQLEEETYGRLRELRVHARLTPQIGCNGIVPSRENLAGFDSER
jgi:hypothetical protein